MKVTMVLQGIPHFLPVGGGGGGVVLQISSDRDDRVGVKFKTPKNP